MSKTTRKLLAARARGTLSTPITEASCRTMTQATTPSALLAVPGSGSRPATAQDDVGKSPSTSKTRLMQQLSISFEAGSYQVDGLRYDNLVDAVSYARTCLGRHVAGLSKASDALLHVLIKPRTARNSEKKT